MRMYLELERKNPPFIIGEQFHKALKQLGFIEEIYFSAEVLKKHRLLECQTILSHRDKIQVKFIENLKKHNPSNEERESFEISIKELIS